MSLIIQKYGGSSLASPRHIRRAAERIAALKSQGHELVVVVSAMGRMTDHLIRLAERTVKTPPQRELDMLLTAGERVSMSLLAMALEECGVKAISFTGSQSGIVTTNQHTNAKIIDIRGNRVREELAKGRVVIVAGFQGVSETKEITTLGRGGSDTTAVALAAYLGAELCEVLTDVDGLFTADPRLVPAATLIENCTYEEALEMASLGAKMQARSIEMARKFEVPVRIASSTNTEGVGTQVGPFVGEERSSGAMEKARVRGVATKTGFSFLRVSLSLAELAKHCETSGVGLRFFQNGKNETSFLCEADKLKKLRPLIAESLLEEDSHVSIVSLVGEGLGHSEGVLPALLDAVGASGGECRLVTANALSLTVAVADDKRGELSRLLHAKFVEN